MNIMRAGHLHPVHEGQSADDHHHPAGPLRQDQELAAGETTQEWKPGILHLPALEVQQEEGPLDWQLLNQTKPATAPPVLFSHRLTFPNFLTVIAKLSKSVFSPHHRQLARDGGPGPTPVLID